MFPVKRLFPFQRTTPRNCFQILGVDVLLDSSLQPCLGRRNQSFTMKKRARLKVARLRLCSGNPALYLLLSSYITSFHHFYLHHFKSQHFWFRPLVVRVHVFFRFLRKTPPTRNTIAPTQELHLHSRWHIRVP